MKILPSTGTIMFGIPPLLSLKHFRTVYSVTNNPNNSYDSWDLV